MPAPKPADPADSRSSRPSPGKRPGKPAAKAVRPARKPARKPGKVYQLKVSLNDLRPAVWRRLLVRETCSLARLHGIIQIAMGWQDSHLHLFTFDGRRFGNPRLLDLADLAPESIQLRKVLTQPKQRMFYTYDMGDNWHHQVVLEAIQEAHPRATFPKCIDGARACPPEDVGGSWGYEHLLAVLADPTHEEYEHLSGWVGRPVDATAFDLALVNALLQAAR